MTDGPFRNLKLSSHWKRFVEAANNDAVDGTERCALAAHALVAEILTNENQVLLTDLQAYPRRAQLDLNAMSSIECIFSNHHKSPFADSLQKELDFRLSEQMAPEVTIERALEASVDGQIRRVRNRIEEECIRARESGEMGQDQFDRTVKQANAAFDALPKTDICDALRVGDKKTFKNAAAKKMGLDEGPKL